MKYVKYFDELSEKEYLLRSEVSYVKDTDWDSYKPKRGGMIMYMIIDGRLIFYMGRDKKYKEYTDFGGTINYKKEDGLSGAIRELKEETYKIFGRINGKILRESIIVKSENSFIIFYQICEQKNYIELFEEKIKDKKRNEIDLIVELNESKFIDLVYNKSSKIYLRVRNLLLTDNSIYHIILSIKQQNFCSDKSELNTLILEWLYKNYDDIPRTMSDMVMYLEDNLTNDIPDNFNFTSFINLYDTDPFFLKYLIIPREYDKTTRLQNFIISSLNTLLHTSPIFFSSSLIPSDYIDRSVLENFVHDNYLPKTSLIKIHDTITVLIKNSWISYLKSNPLFLTLSI